MTFDLVELLSGPIAALTAVGVVVVGLGGNGGGDELNLDREPLLIFLPPARPGLEGNLKRIFLLGCGLPETVGPTKSLAQMWLSGWNNFGLR